MADEENKQVLAANLRRFMEEQGKTRAQVCADLGFKYSTFCEWLQGVKYPRIDKIERLAAYFGVRKADLIEAPGPRPAPDVAQEVDASFFQDYGGLAEHNKELIRDMVRVMLERQQGKEEK